MERALSEVDEFNDLLRRENIMNIGAIAEIEAWYLALCEMMRNLHDISPPSLKRMWLCLGNNIL